jgi:hypothetical protein
MLLYTARFFSFTNTRDGPAVGVNLPLIEPASSIFCRLGYAADVEFDRDDTELTELVEGESASLLVVLFRVGRAELDADRVGEGGGEETLRIERCRF